MISSLRARLTLLLLLSTLPVAILMILAATDRRTRAIEEIRATTSNTLQLIVKTQEQAVVQARSTVQWLAEFPEIHDVIATGNVDACQRRLEKLFAESTGFTGFSIAAPDGTVVCRVPITPTVGTTQTLNLAKRPAFQHAIATKQFAMGSVQPGAVSNQLALSFSYPVLDADGKVELVIGTGLDIKKMNDAVTDLRMPASSSFLIMDQTGTIAVRFPNPEQWMGKTVEDEPLIQHILKEVSGTTFLTGADGGERFYAYTPVILDSNIPLYAAVGVSTNDAFAQINRIMRRDLVGLATISLTALVLAWWVSDRTLLQPIRQIATTAKALGEGKLTTRTELRSGAPELIALAAAIDQMSETLQVRDAQLRQLNVDLERRVQERTAQLQASNAKLHGFQTQLRQLATQTNTAIEAERTRIAREVHDELGQTLTGMKMDLMAAKRRLDPKQEPALLKLNSAIKLLDETVHSVRRISAELRPGMLDDLGLVSAIVWHLREFEERTSIDCNFTPHVSGETFGYDVSTSTYRILQEALNNIARHAKAHKVDVSLEDNGNELTMTVTDDGIGIDQRQLIDPNSLGLMGMNERALRLGGSVEINGTSSKGTQVLMRIPLRPTGPVAVLSETA